MLNRNLPIAVFLLITYVVVFSYTTVGSGLVQTLFGKYVIQAYPLRTALGSLATTTTSSGKVPRTAPRNLEENSYVVQRVVDGDTIVLAMHGRDQKIRIIGLDTPEVVAPHKPVQCYGPEATVEAQKVLNGQTIILTTDPSQGEYDVYHRILGYVFLADGTNYEEYMLENGFGREYTYRTPYQYQKQFRAAQTRAKNSKKGLWKVCVQ